MNEVSKNKSYVSVSHTSLDQLCLGTDMTGQGELNIPFPLNLAGNSVENLVGNVAGKSCGKILWEILRENLARNSCRNFLWEIWQGEREGVGDASWGDVM